MACDKAIKDARYYSKIEGKKEGKIEDIKNIMLNLQISVAKALNIIGVPESEWNMYITMINGTNKKITV